MSALVIRESGPFSLLQDRGRFGKAALGLTTGGPLDPMAARLANRLLANHADATLIEVSFGGLHVVADGDVQLAVAGAEVPITIEGAEAPSWTVLELRDGQGLRLGFASRGCRAYLAVRGGFAIAPSFGSTATVPREHIGGLDGGPLAKGDRLPIAPAAPAERRWLPPAQRPRYHHRATVRVVPGYQQRLFSRDARRRFFGSEYRVSRLSDRMGCRLEGPAIPCSVGGILSEGIAPGAIQLPGDGQPIVMLADRQTIGGYPKIGAALSVDCAALAQLSPGDAVSFTPITTHTARRALHGARLYELARRFEASPR
ncbi:MAG: biotin-dependent carboxyltransferase family protein [Halieaceae bacterium]|nr:biotin-dependent carboxyltransferase family protein [Halieaceae bacterium]